MARKVSNSKRGGRKRLTKNKKQFQDYVRSNLLSGNTNDNAGKWRSAGVNEEKPFKGTTHGLGGGKVKSKFNGSRRAIFISCKEPGCHAIPGKFNDNREYCHRHY